MTDRDFDIVLFGATGFVGRLTAQHLADEAKGAADGVRIALAGRSQSKLEGIRTELTGPAREWPLLVVDAADTGAVQDLAARTKVVVTTVGPYQKYGKALVAACAAAGTHYCDLTGEVLFVKDTIDKHDKAARRSGARIVHACGFDSIPSDLGVFLTWRTAAEDGAGDLARTQLAVTQLKGGFSGGTVDSARNQAAEVVKDAGARAVMANPWSLADGPRPARPARSAATDPPAHAARPTSVASAPAAILDAVLGRATKIAKSSPVRRNPAGHFTGPFIMANFNTRVVCRSASLLGYGEGFRYGEHTDFGPGPKGALMATGMSFGLGVGGLALAFGPTRKLVDPLLPKPGEGPSDEAMARGRFRMDITAETTSGARYLTTVSAPYDPGYSGTAIMLGQAALALVNDTASLPDRVGVLTPSSGIGMPLIERLRRHRFSFETRRTDQ